MPDRNMKWQAFTENVLACKRRMAREYRGWGVGRADGGAPPAQSWQASDQVGSSKLESWQASDQVGSSELENWQASDQVGSSKLESWQASDQLGSSELESCLSTKNGGLLLSLELSLDQVVGPVGFLGPNSRRDNYLIARHLSSRVKVRLAGCEDLISHAKLLLPGSQRLNRHAKRLPHKSQAPVLTLEQPTLYVAFVIVGIWKPIGGGWWRLVPTCGKA